MNINHCGRLKYCKVTIRANSGGETISHLPREDESPTIMYISQ